MSAIQYVSTSSKAKEGGGAKSILLSSLQVYIPIPTCSVSGKQKGNAQREVGNRTEAWSFGPNQENSKRNS